ncbi:hypothetical protein ACO0K3_18070 [Undibacterium sp. Rencai35W]|uniref:hypothetical protein n=1 Tax=Undibacterium sp. Rencai35W TaxID=3413046 RepID=UPI003BF1EC69
MKKILFAMFGFIPLALALTPDISHAGECSPAGTTNLNLPESRLLMFGEIHGTQEIPRFVGRVVCELATGKKARPVVLIMEIASEEQTIINAYLNSDGTYNDERNLLSGPFWSRSMQDGRSSIAMFELIKLIRELRYAGASVNLVAMDLDANDWAIVVAEKGDVGNMRDSIMARNIQSAQKKYSDATIVTLVGNYHIDKQVHQSGKTKRVPLGSHLVSSGVVTLDVVADGGMAWICTGQSAEPTCAPSMVGKKRRVSGSLAVIETELGANPDGSYFLGATTASPPAIQSLIAK